MRRLPIVVLAAIAAAVHAPPATALVGSTVATLSAPSEVAARDGVVAFATTAADGRHQIVVRERGRSRPVGVAPQARPFALAMGTGGGLTRPALVYPRCTGAEADTCRLVVTPLASDVERAVPGTRGALRGALSGTTLVAAVRDDDGRLRLVVRSGRNHTLRVPRRVYTASGRRREIPPATVALTDLDVRGDTLAYVLTFGVPSGPFARSELWTQRIGGPPRRLASIGTGGASSGLRAFLGIRLQRTAVVAYRQGRDQGNALVRLSLRTGRKIGGVNLGQTPFDDIVSGAYDGGRYAYLVREYTGRSTGCEAGLLDGSDATAPGTCALYDSGPLRFDP